MYVLAGTQARMARLCHVMYVGERIAHRCATGQAALVVDYGQRLFLKLQARQENKHAFAYSSIVALLAPRGTNIDTPATKVLSEYEQFLMSDIDRRDLAGSVIGMQDILEGIGARLLSATDRFVEKHNPRHVRLHRLIARQEAAHHAFGKHWLRNGDEDETSTQHREKYQALANRLHRTCTSLLEDLGIDPNVWFVADAPNREKSPVK